MGDSSDDPMAVTMKIRRETRVANERAAAARAASAAGEVQLPPPIPGTKGALHVAAPAEKAVELSPDRLEGQERSVDPETAYRRARMGVVAVVVLVLLLLWIRQRRAWAR
ncbi:MAG: hypothetical protein IJG13_11275 [Kiritimatiellae bacterium]|nr:hypothetical protein [Kiritimatiellia bacterium]